MTSHWRFGSQVWIPRKAPRIMGIINVTPDSFSYGGRYCDVVATVSQGRQLVADGSDVRCVADGQIVSCPLGTLTVGESVTVRIVTVVSPDAPAGESIGNAVTTSTATPDPSP